MKFMSDPMLTAGRLALGGWLLLFPVLVNGQNAFSPGGPEYAIAGALSGDQTFPQAAVSATGGYLVWQDNAVGTNGLNVRAMRLNAGFTSSGPIFRVNAQSVGEHEKPRVALLNNGGAVFVWQGGKPGRQKIYARFLNTNGSFLTTNDVLVNTYTNAFQIDPAVATLADGNVVVVWASSGQDGSLQGIFGQRLSASGAKIGSEFRINQFTINNQRTPTVAALSNGNFVVAWVSELQRASSSVDVYARIFNPSGEAVTSEFPVNLTTSNVCANPAVATSPKGGFAVVWGQNDSVVSTVGSQNGVQVSAGQTRRSPNRWDVYGRVFDANGSALTAPVRLNTWTLGDQFAPKISAFGNNYLVVWVSLGQDNSWEGIFGQFLSRSGGLEGVEFRVNTTTPSRQIHPSVASDGLNRFLVLWSSFGAGTSFDLFARAYDLIRVEMTPKSADSVSISWNTQPGCVYQLQSSTNLTGWTNVGPARTATGYNDAVTVTPNVGAAYYRVIRIR